MDPEHREHERAPVGGLERRREVQLGRALEPQRVGGRRQGSHFTPEPFCILQVEHRLHETAVLDEGRAGCRHALGREAVRAACQRTQRIEPQPQVVAKDGLSRAELCIGKAPLSVEHGRAVEMVKQRAQHVVLDHLGVQDHRVSPAVHRLGGTVELVGQVQHTIESSDELGVGLGSA